MERAARDRAELRLSDQSQFSALREFLSWAVPDVEKVLIPGQPVRGEQGVLDVLALVASSSSLVATIKILPEFLRSRRTALSVSITVAEKTVTLTATNIDEVLPVLERLLQ